MAENLGNSRNILVGAASLYLGKAGLADPTVKPEFKANESYRTTITAPAAVTAGWKSVGYTQEGLEVSYEPEYGDVEVDQLLDSAVVFKQSMRVSLNTTLAEATLYNLMLAWGQSDDTLDSSVAGESTLEIEGGSLGDAPVERPFVAVGNAPIDDGKYGERVYHVYRTLNVEQSTHSMRRNENTGIPVSFRALPSESGKYGTIKDRKRTTW